jgi:exodeoxyribonuclease VII large subunit
MTRRLPLSTLAALVQESIEQVFGDETFWVIAEITDVKRYEQKRWCFLKFLEKQREQVLTEMQGVFWAQAYQQIQQFERRTGQRFQNGLEISCRVAVRFHPRYGLKLEVLEIDSSYTLGQLEMQRQQTLDQLLRQYPSQISLEDGEYHTPNKRLQWPPVLQRIALVAAPGSDGERDFLQELAQNQYGYAFHITRFSTSVQGQYAVDEICERLDEIRNMAPAFDVVALVRGGGSQTDFAPFDHFEVARRVALFPIPVFTGIGHDRNTSIADLMGWQYKTPTKVAAAIADTALRFESNLLQLQQQLSGQVQQRLLKHRQQLQRWQHQLGSAVPGRVQHQRQQLVFAQLQVQQHSRRRLAHWQQQLRQQQAQVQHHSRQRLLHTNQQLQQLQRLLKELSPDRILQRGFAVLVQNGRIVADIETLQPQLPLQARLKNHLIETHIQTVRPYESGDDI